jgi:hypothetical protein
MPEQQNLDRCPAFKSFEGLRGSLVVTTRHAQKDIHILECARMQSTFQVDLVSRGNGADDEPPKKQRPFINRKTHKKSRSGCSACKKRHIKVGSTCGPLNG